MTLAETRRTAAPGGAMAAIARLLEQRTGQQIAANRAWRLETTLQPLLRELGHSSVEPLAASLRAAPHGALADRVVDALLNQETSFFRDAAMLDQLADAAVAMQDEEGRRRLRLWSAGCSTGQEVLSLAMLLRERGLGEPDRFPEIVATDVSTGAIARARRGRFTQFEIQRGLSVRRMIEWFEPDGDDWVARRDLYRNTLFRQQNLAIDLPPGGCFDIVLCRNVLLYFSPEMRRRVFDRIACAVRPGGLLVLGAGETVIGQTEAFAPSETWRGFYHRTEAHTALPSAVAG